MTGYYLPPVAATAASLLSVPDIAAVIAIVLFAVAGTGGAVAYLLAAGRRPAASGPSTPRSCGNQASGCGAELEAQRDKAIEQRDRLIESQSAQVLPC